MITALRACEAVGSPARYEVAAVKNDDEALDLVVSLNQHRRHLTNAQRAFAAARLANMAHGGDKNAKSSKELLAKKTSLEHAAKKTKTSKMSANRARAILNHGTKDDEADVVSGKTSLAAKANKLRKGLPKRKSPTKRAAARHKMSLPPYTGPKDYPGAEEIKGLDPNQRVHLHSYKAKQLMDAQSVVEIAIGQIAPIVHLPDGAEFFAAIDKMLAWKIQPGAKYGEQTDFAKRARRDLEALDQTLDKAIARLASIKAELDARQELVRKPRVKNDSVIDLQISA